MVLEAQTDHKGNLGAEVANMADPDELPVAHMDGRGRGEPVQHLIHGFLQQVDLGRMVGSTRCPEGTLRWVRGSQTLVKRNDCRLLREVWGTSTRLVEWRTMWVRAGCVLSKCGGAGGRW
jgi:hypothetical protein